MDEAPKNLIQRATDVWGRRVLLVHTATRRISDVKHRDEERCRRRHKQRDAKGHVAHADLDSILSATYWEFSRTDVALLDAMLADERISLLLGIAQRMKVSSGYASAYRTCLLQKGLIRKQGRGHVAFDLPGLKTYVAIHAREESE